MGTVILWAVYGVEPHHKGSDRQASYRDQRAVHRHARAR